MTKYEFGIMSSKFELDADCLKHAKMAMCLFIGKNIPIAIYKPDNSSSFMPIDFLKEGNKTKFNGEAVRHAFDSIKKLL